MDTPTTHARAGQLDGIRALCVLAVVFSHTITDSYRIGQYTFYEFGSYGVSMFFVLSGFLITGQLLVTQDQRLAYGDGPLRPLMLFYGKRMLRLFPAYYLALFVAIAIGIPGIREELPWHAAQLTDILNAIYPEIENSSAASHFWSLTVEWQFYLVWPLVVMLAPNRALPWVIGVVLAVSVYSWSGFADLNPVLDRTNILQSLSSLSFGVLLGYAAHRGCPLGWLSAAAWPAAALALAAPLASMTHHGRTAEWLAMPSHEAMNLAFAALVWRASSGLPGMAGRLLDLAPLRYVGVISYGIYVYHEFILTVFGWVWLRFGWGEVVYGAALTLELFVASVIVAAVSWHFIELPINRQRRRLAYRPRSAPDAPGTVARDIA